ncbi:MAG: hypothetical protein ACMUEM_06175 [Flavobacteriales bacterium AspAUS03]
MKILVWSLVLVLFIVACDDDERFNKGNEAKNYSHEIYRWPNAPGVSQTVIREKNNNCIYEFPEPKNSEQKKHWIKTTLLNDSKKRIGNIKAIEDGIIDISGFLAINTNDTWELKLWIGDREDISQKTPIVTFNAKNSKLIKNQRDEFYEYEFHEENIPIKKDEKIIFKCIKDIHLQNLIVYFKPNGDKKIGEGIGGE